MKTTTKLLIGLIVAIVMAIVSGILFELGVLQTTSGMLIGLSVFASVILFIELVVEIEVDE